MLTVDIKKSFPGFSLSVQFEAGDGVTALLGASGCGKSVTLKCIAGVMKPDAGAIYRDGRALFDKKRGVNLPPQKRRVGLLFQDYALFPNMTLLENVEAGLMAIGDRAARRKRALSLMEGFGLARFGDSYPRELSAGQQQRAALCRMLGSEPRTLLLDEPFSALDTHLRWRLEQEMTEALGGFSGSVLLVTHDRGEAYRLSERACVMENGRNEAVVPTETLFAAPRTSAAARLSGCKNITAARRLGAHQLLVPAWGEELNCGAEISPAARHIGVRAHYLRFGAAEEENAVPVLIERVVPDLFSAAYICRADGGGALCVELPKGTAAPQAGARACVIVPKDAIMLLE